jgi:hypothetical protein
MLIDQSGTYVVELSVSSGGVAGPPVQITLSTTNQPPTARIDAVRQSTTGAFLLDGSKSYDLDREAVSYGWTLTSRPAGSTASIASPAAPIASVTPDVAGSYVATLVVTDSRGAASAPRSVTFVRGDSGPSANAGPAQSVAVGATVQLDAFNSIHIEGRLSTSSWSLVSKPTGSGAALSAPNLGRVSLTPDVAGDYVAHVIVSDGTFSSTIQC